MTPIGYLRGGTASKGLAYRQTEGTVEVLPEYVPALADLEGFTRIWPVWLFHKNSGWRPKVLPPGGRVGRKGLFATRSPHRPNPLGLTAVPLVSVEGSLLHIGAHDLVDGTPIVDIKPYIPSSDAFPEESSGWFAETLVAPRYTVELRADAPAELRERIVELLSRDPLPHRTRRIVVYEDGYRLSLGRARVFYRVEGERVIVYEVRKG
jgi:tRNA-Thr(GGU) m(6)t(6)A37 methyltransferase TsaA